MSWRFFYNSIAVSSMEAGLRLGGLGLKKVRAGIRVRSNEAEQLKLVRSHCREGVPRILFHCSSAGELESAVPLMEELRKHHNIELLLSIYSSSAESRAQELALTNDFFYLPFDSARRVRRMLDILEPSVVVFVKHDIWPNLVWICRDRSIPTVLVNGNFRPDSTRLYPVLRGFNRAVLGGLSSIFAVAGDDAGRFRMIAGPGPRIKAAGDTRFDRVRQRALASRGDQGALAELLLGRKVAVAGSTWPEDEKRIFEAWRSVRKQVSNSSLILAPHEPEEVNLRRISEHARRSGFPLARLSAVEQGEQPPDRGIILIDRTGILAGLYGLGEVAYVGGGFGKGVHSVIEPAVFGVPVLFGPNYLMSHEARDLTAVGAASSITRAGEVEEVFLDALTGGSDSRKRGDLAAHFVEEKTGASQRLAGNLAEMAGN